jgi:hypothetical protein
MPKVNIYAFVVGFFLAVWIGRRSRKGTASAYFPDDIYAWKKLLSCIRADIQPSEVMAPLRGGATIPETRIYCTQGWLAEGSYSDIMIQSGLSKTSYYRVVWETIKAIATSKHMNLQIRIP